MHLSGGGGSGAAGTITVATGSITSITITNHNRSGYTSAPTVLPATGGYSSPPLTALIGGVGGQEVAAGTNLSGETSCGSSGWVARCPRRSTARYSTRFLN